MANNRMSIRCTVCDETARVAKYYPTITDGWYVSRPVDLDEFLSKHSFCSGGALHGNTSFDLVFEEGQNDEGSARG